MIDNTFKAKVTPRITSPTTFEVETEIINPVTEIANQFYRQVVNLEDQAIRTALIAMGWTPPKE